MRIQIRLFAILRERAETGALELELPEGASVSSAIAQIATRLPAIRELLPRAAFAVNREYVSPDAILHDRDELALIPPVCGGCA